MASDCRWRCLLLLLFTHLLCFSLAQNSDKPKKKKDIRDYNDADMARLLEQWEKDDDIEEGDLPEHRRSPPPVDFSKVDPSKPEELLKMSKKGRTLMVFATVSGEPSEKETEEITGLWQGSLFNANFDVQRFVVDSNRVIFMLRDGSMAWEVKDFLVSQERCADVTVEGQVFPGKAAKSDSKTKPQNEDTGKKKNKKRTDDKKPDDKKPDDKKPDDKKPDDKKPDDKKPDDKKPDDKKPDDKKPDDKKPDLEGNRASHLKQEL